MFVSIFNDVLGPVMRGPSSSHTAGSYHIAKTVSSLLGDAPVSASFKFDTNGSYSKTYVQQAADRAFAMGIMGLPLTDDKFVDALKLARQKGINIEFAVSDLKNPNHPNSVEITLTSKSGNSISASAASTGGGTFIISQFNGFPVEILGKRYHLMINCSKSAIPNVAEVLTGINSAIRTNSSPKRQRRDVVSKKDNIAIQSIADSNLLTCTFNSPPDDTLIASLRNIEGVEKVTIVSPVYYTQKGQPLFDSAASMVAYAQKNNLSLGAAALQYESQLLGLSPQQVLDEMIHRYNIMADSVATGLNNENVNMQLLAPSAANVMSAEKENRLPIGGLHTKAAANALAVMHACNSMSIVCAAPTGGSAGVIPATVVTLANEYNLPPERAAMLLLAASAIGLITENRATFAAEIAGCQVEIGAAGAMASAAVVEFANGPPASAADAAAIAFQNTMGSVCDLVQGICEIPCHTRNATAASNAFVCADLIMGGYKNPIPLDETIDAVFQTGKLLPPQLRCTAQGGIAIAPSALTMKKQSPK